MWFVFVTAIVAYLSAQAITMAFDKFSSRLRNPLFIPVKFAIFCVFIVIGGAIAGEYSKELISGGLFETPSSTTYYVAWGLNFIPPAFLYGDFLYRAKVQWTKPRVLTWIVLVFIVGMILLGAMLISQSLGVQAAPIDWVSIFVGALLAVFLYYLDGREQARFVRSQIDEKIAVLLGFATQFSGMQVAAPSQSPAMPPKMLGYSRQIIEMNITAMGRYGKHAFIQEQLSGLEESLKAIMSEMNRLGLQSDAEAIQNVYKRYFQ